MPSFRDLLDLVTADETLESRRKADLRSTIKSAGQWLGIDLTAMRAASAFFNIEPDVLNTIGELTSTRGGANEGRKAEGRAIPLSRAERQWLDAAFRALVRRVAEQAYHAGPPPKPLTMSDLPKLTP